MLGQYAQDLVLARPLRAAVEDAASAGGLPVLYVRGIVVDEDVPLGIICLMAPVDGYELRIGAEVLVDPSALVGSGFLYAAMGLGEAREYDAINVARVPELPEQLEHIFIRLQAPVEVGGAADRLVHLVVGRGALDGGVLPAHLPEAAGEVGEDAVHVEVDLHRRAPADDGPWIPGMDLLTRHGRVMDEDGYQVWDVRDVSIVAIIIPTSPDYYRMNANGVRIRSMGLWTYRNSWAYKGGRSPAHQATRRCLGKGLTSISNNHAYIQRFHKSSGRCVCSPNLCNFNFIKKVS